VNKAGSIQRRLAAAALLWLCAALVGAGFGLVEIFRGQAASILESHLIDDMDHVVAAIEAVPDGTVRLTRALPDSLYDRPYSGRYWQIEVAGRPMLRSRSLWDFTLPNPPDELKPGEIHRHRLAGPDGQTLIAVERSVGLEGLERPVRLVVASDENELAQALVSFRTALAFSLAALGAGLALAVALQIHFGLAPLRRLRAAVLDLKRGREAALDEVWPREVAPLVADLKDVIARNRNLVERARAEADNLAHALKTPLAVLRNEADGGAPPSAEIVRVQSAAMQGHIERHLARARAGAASAQSGLQTDARTVVLRLADALGRVHRDRTIRTLLRGADLTFAGSPDDLSDIVGNVLDNALKWAKRDVRLSLTRSGPQLQCVVEDDGPGIAPEARAEVLRRGARLDEAMPGTGFGLAITDELVAFYKGSVALETSELGGLKVVLRLPAPA
jgi:signal transduction histidine kinase